MSGQGNVDEAIGSRAVLETQPVAGAFRFKLFERSTRRANGFRIHKISGGEISLHAEENIEIR